MSRGLELARKMHSFGKNKGNNCFADDWLKLTHQERFQGQQYMMALEMNDKNSMERIEHCASNIDAGGVLETNIFLRRQQFAASREHSFKEREQALKKGIPYFLTPGVDNISGENICYEDISSLTKCNINDLLKNHRGMIATGKILWVTSIEPVFPLACIMMCVMDDNNTSIDLSLYNIGSLSASKDELNIAFPVGLRIGIKSPYLKMANADNLNLRVDNPMNVIFELKSVQPLKITENALEIKNRGNERFKSKEYLQAIEEYSDGIESAKLLLENLYSNRAFSKMKILDFVGAKEDCELILKTNSSHVKALHHLEKAKLGLETREKQRDGFFDFRTFPFEIDMQSREESYYGPIVIGAAGLKGRGLFLTRDVLPGELLLAEKSVAYKRYDDKTIVMASNYDTNRTQMGGQHFLVSDIVKRLQAEGDLNSKLSYLSFDDISSNKVIPDIDCFRNNSFPEVPVLSAKRLAGIVNVNAFGQADIILSQAEREALHKSYHSDNFEDFFKGFMSRQKQNIERCDKPERSKDGTALWVVGSFMNHTKQNWKKIFHEFIGGYLFVVAHQPMFSGQELLISYGDSWNCFGTQGIL
jgi:hypothetical protein